MISRTLIGLSLCSWNANGILSKINEFKLFVEKYSPDIILVQETKLRLIHNIRIANYTCYRNDRVADGHAVGGGTLIMIKNSINHFNTQTPQLHYTEATVVTINPPNFNPLTIIGIYIPPSSDNRLFTLDIENLIQINSSCVIFGDFNATHNAWNCSNNSIRGNQLKNFTDILDIEIAFPDTPTRSARKANLLLAKEHHEELMAIAANQSPSPAQTPSKSSSEIEVSNIFSTPVKCKRTFKSPNKGTAKKSKPSEEVIALSNSYSAIAPIEEDAEDLSNTEDTVVDTAPGTEEEVNTPQAPVEDPSNIDMIDKEQENSDEPLLADDASGHTSSSTKDIQPKKRTPPIVIDEQYNTPGLLLEISEIVGRKVMGKIVGRKLKVFPEDSDAHRKIQNFISVKKLKSHTYEMAGEKQLKTVIRGLPSDFDVDEIIQELGTHNITPEHVSVMRNRKQNKNMPLFCVKYKFGELRNFLCDEYPDIIGIQETHLGPADSFKLPNYICHRSDRLSHRGGGTAIFVRNSLRHHVVSFNTNTFENTTVKLELGNNTHLTLSCIYKPPRNHINTTELDAILNASPKIMLFGDFNAHHPCWNPGRLNTHGNSLYNWASAHALDIMAPTAPTYYAARGTCSILDIAFAKNLILEDINSLNDLSSDHNPVLIDLALNNSLPKNLRTLKSTNWIKFQEIVFNSSPGNPVIDANNIDNAILITGMITSAISATTVTKRQIKTQISEHRNKSWHNLLSNLHPEDNSLYNLQRKLVKKPTIIPPLAGRNGILYPDDEKAEEFKNNLEATFQENSEPYNDTIIELVESETLSYDFLANSKAGCPQGFCLSHHLNDIYTYDFPHHPSVSICLFADDAAVFAQAANLKYTQCTLQRYLHTLESWLTDWRIAINVDKTQATVFRKHGCSKIPKTLSLFDEDIEWVNVLLLPSALVRVVRRSGKWHIKLNGQNNSAGTATDEVCPPNGRLPCLLRSDWPRPVARRNWAWEWIGSIRK
ncbi:probable RNA-directed DNA polymerase from transposon X-element [Trichonephila clavipes]|nr:probable RNA-directed DNA polymerase from transposon X-element [Trichonephila clavipes]